MVSKKEMTAKLEDWLQSGPTHDMLFKVYALLFPCSHARIHRSGSSKLCADCNKHFGWWCPESPDNSCHYFSHVHYMKGKRKNVVDLSTGDMFVLPDLHNSRYENEDSCLFCKQPDERY